MYLSRKTELKINETKICENRHCELAGNVLNCAATCKTIDFFSKKIYKITYCRIFVILHYRILKREKEKARIKIFEVI